MGNKQWAMAKGNSKTKRKDVGLKKVKGMDVTPIAYKLI